MTTKPNVVFLYTEVADYFLSACRTLSASCNVTIIRWPVNREAPFDLSAYQSLRLLERDQYSDAQLQEQITALQPDALICSGWMDKGYLKVVAANSGNIPTVLTLDNHWKGTLKQQLARLGASFSFIRHFSYAWVPGDKQWHYARKLGFAPEKIFRGFYTADVTRFDTAFTTIAKEKQAHYPKQFLYLGRYVKHKGIFDLWQAFQNYRAAGGTWKLCCAGTGDQWEARPKIEGLEHLGFVQPQDIPTLIKESGAYILPSHEEPWGVSVHEMAAAGLPLLLSDAVGAKDTFLEEGVNGFGFAAHSVEEITEVLHKMEAQDKTTLQHMSKASNAKGKRLSQESWVATVMEILSK